MDQLFSRLEGFGTAALVGLGILLVVELTLMIVGLISLVPRPPSEVRGPKWLWALVIVFVQVVGPIIYFALGRLPEQVDIGRQEAATSPGKAEEVVDVLYGNASGGGRP